MIRIKADLGSAALERLQAQLREMGARAGAFPATSQAVDAAAGLVHGAWRGFALGAPLAGVKPLPGPNKGYAGSIKNRRTGPLEREVFTRSEIAERIEKGEPELDMKKTHPFGPKSRVSADGYPYLIVPFRWGTPGGKNGPRVGFGKNVMTAGAYAVAKKLAKMRTIIDADKAPIRATNARGKRVGRAMYNRGFGRLSGADFAGTVGEKSMMDGMVRSTDSAGKNRSGGYFTFRVVSSRPGARGWVRPAVPARDVLGALRSETEAAAAGVIKAGIMEDLRL
ncbi:MAG: hypothetical protein FWE09_00085 [Treponema sp.]|nr:hypothetical protein [Treponema sp.]